MNPREFLNCKIIILSNCHLSSRALVALVRDLKGELCDPFQNAPVVEAQFLSQTGCLTVEPNQPFHILNVVLSNSTPTIISSVTVKFQFKGGVTTHLRGRCSESQWLLLSLFRELEEHVS